MLRVAGALEDFAERFALPSENGEGLQEELRGRNGAHALDGENEVLLPLADLDVLGVLFEARHVADLQPACTAQTSSRVFIFTGAQLAWKACGRFAGMLQAIALNYSVHETNACAGAPVAQE